MATEELKVKFKVDTSEVKSGADEAKNKVKSAAQQMEGDVKKASSSMEDHLDKVSQSAKGIGDAARRAGGQVQNLEQQVSKSASKMSGDLGKVADEVKKISAMQVAGVASRGLGIAGRAVGWIGENFTEEGSTARIATDVGASALSGAGEGVMLGAAIGSVIPGLGTAVGAAIGGAVGALTGAASELWEASKKLNQSAEERQKGAQDYLQQNGQQLKERERFAGYDKENQVLLNGIGKTWWRSKDGSRSISGEERIFEVERQRKATLDSATNARDEYVRQHQDDTGEAAIKSAYHLEYLNKEVEKAAQHLQALAPVVDAARKSLADQAKAAEDARKAEEAAKAEEARSAAQSYKARMGELNEEKRDSEKTISSLQSQLQGVASRPAQSPTDALTRIGGGRGYASYNNSTAAVQQRIESHLRTLISNEQNQLQEIINKMDALTTSYQATWAS